MLNYRAICLSIASLFWLPSLLVGQNLFDSLKTVQYANYLYQAGAYTEAIDEYERFTFQFDAEDNAKFQLVSSYRKAGFPNKALIRINELWAKPQTVSPKVAKEFYALKIIGQNTNEVFSDITSNNVLSSTDKLFLSSTFFLLNDDYKKTLEVLNSNEPISSDVLTSYKAFAEEGLKLKHKSPVISGALSAVFPGAGKFYTGQWQDGVISFTMVGSSVWQAYKGFKKDGVKSVYGWIFGAIGTGFYIGNITGSVKSANRYNKIKKERIRIRVQTIFYNNI